MNLSDSVFTPEIIFPYNLIRNDKSANIKKKDVVDGSCVKGDVDELIFPDDEPYRISER